MTNGGKKIEAQGPDEKLVLDFLAVTNQRDLEGLMKFFREDSVWHNMPVAPVSGLAGIRAVMAELVSAFTTIHLETLSIASRSGVVFTERVDHFRTAGGRAIDLPVAGTFVVEQGKIKLWRDYFDLATWEAQSGIKLA
ncbi:MAG: limonene-1,2-epoxide hydrolase family protein [Minicystis sp.]